MDPWHTLKLRRRWLLGLWLGWLPLMGALEAWQRRGLSAAGAVLLAVGYLGVLLGLAQQVRRARCPQCGGAFHSGTRVRLPSLLAWRCDSCHAPVGAPLP
jgi:hypothetical protein